MQQRREPVHLPTEMWLKIFAIATRLPGGLIPPPHIDITDTSPHQWSTSYLEKREKARLELKLRMVLVCRSWRQMATEFLYENVHIYQEYDQRRRVPVKVFRQTLESTTAVHGIMNVARKKRRLVAGQAHEGDGGMPNYAELGYGRWVKQLELDVDCVSVEDVAAIVRRCPNLRTLIVQKTNSWNQHKVGTILLRAISEELRCIQLLRSMRVPRSLMSQEFSAILHKRPSIQAASLSCGNVHFGDEPLPPSQLRALTLIKPDTEHLLALGKWELPSLTHLTLHRATLGRALLSVIQRFGLQLLFLDIYPENLYLEKCHLSQCSSSISSSCPRLRGIVLHDEDLLPLNLHSLTHLAVTFHGWDSVPMDKLMVSELPALRYVRVFTRHPSYRVVPPDSSKDWVVECRARGIRVEGDDGMDLLDPPYLAKISRNEIHYQDPCTKFQPSTRVHSALR